MPNDSTLDYLTENRIEDHVCDPFHAFAFFSYSHDQHDAQIVREVFRELTNRGFNLWLDAANLPYDARSWKCAALQALRNEFHNCRLLVFFRSEASIVRGTILEELRTFSGQSPDNGGCIVTVEIYRDPETRTRNILGELQKKAASGPEAQADLEVCRQICEIVDPSCNAIRFLHEAGEDIKALADAIEARLVSHGVFQRFLLAEKMPYILDGKLNISLQGDQTEVYNILVNMCRRTFGWDENNIHIPGDGRRRVLIVQGGPGTGKTALMMYMVSKLLPPLGRPLPQKVRVLSKNISPKKSYELRLQNDPESHETAAMKKRFDTVFMSEHQWAYRHYLSEHGQRPPETFDYLFIDEAHRLISNIPVTIRETNRLTGQKTSRREIVHDSIDKLMLESKCTVLFTDNDQTISLDDRGHTRMLFSIAERHFDEDCIFGVSMKSQLRCLGATSFIKWVDGVMSGDIAGKYSAKTAEYDLHVFDSASEMYREICRKNSEEGLSRIVAGYCWNWNSAWDKNVLNVRAGDLSLSWNLPDSTFAARADSINEVGCVHTVQGMEFYYCGVIIGNDMKYEDGKITTHYENRASDDNSLNGLNNMEEAEKKRVEDMIIRNTYKVLLTRGIKGCFIYCTDQALNEYLKRMANRFNSSYLY